MLLAARIVVSISNFSDYSPQRFNALNNFSVIIFNFQYYAYSVLFSYFVLLLLFFQLCCCAMFLQLSLSVLCILQKQLCSFFP